MDLMKLRRRLMLMVPHGGGGLPSEYQQVSYLEATGNQWIDTGVSLQNEKDIYIEVDFETNSNASADNGILCGGSSGSTTAWKLPNWCDQQIEIRGYGLTTNSLTTLARQTRLKLTFDFSDNSQRIVKNDSNVLLTDTKQWIQGNAKTLFMFARHNDDDGVSWKANAKIYNAYIKLGSTVVRNFIPCYRKADNVAGMYDLANGVFYTNDGTGTFNVGSDV